jgi:hypothetical protein
MRRVNNAAAKKWARARTSGKWRYVSLRAIVYSAVLSALFVAGKIAGDLWFRDIRYDWIDSIGGWSLTFAILLVVTILWLSLKWNRREAAYRLVLDDDQDLGHTEWK